MIIPERWNRYLVVAPWWRHPFTRYYVGDMRLPAQSYAYGRRDPLRYKLVRVVRERNGYLDRDVAVKVLGRFWSRGAANWAREAARGFDVTERA